MKLRPVDFATDGVFIAGLAHYHKPTEECIAQAKAAAARAAVILAQDAIRAGGVGVCPFGDISYLENQGVCEVNQALCKGCGTYAANCDPYGQ
jgi:heterodisulfide reductase subunit A